jgi:hypothetical protein
MEHSSIRPIGDILKERQNIILKGADAATRGGFTQVVASREWLELKVA